LGSHIGSISASEGNNVLEDCVGFRKLSEIVLTEELEFESSCTLQILLLKKYIWRQNT
jgi:hypothetical protein